MVAGPVITTRLLLRQHKRRHVMFCNAPAQNLAFIRVFRILEKRNLSRKISAPQSKTGLLGALEGHSTGHGPPHDRLDRVVLDVSIKPDPAFLQNRMAPPKPSPTPPPPPYLSLT